MIARFNRFGQLESDASAAVATPPNASPLTFYLVAVAAGVTVYLITRVMSRRSRA